MSFKVLYKNVSNSKFYKKKFQLNISTHWNPKLKKTYTILKVSIQKMSGRHFKSVQWTIPSLDIEVLGVTNSKYF
jgi:hypothetical protein